MSLYSGCASELAILHYGCPDQNPHLPWLTQYALGKFARPIVKQVLV